MRIRKRKWAVPELQASSFFIANPKEHKGKWKEVFGNNNPICIELGCGRGGFLSQLASQNLDKNYIGIDLISDMLGYAKRNIEKEYKRIDKQPNNVRIFSYQIELILDLFEKKDEIDCIYINFCNPWPRPKHKKRRLTHTRQLEKYKEFLKEQATVFFKTDDDELFRESIRYFQEAGFSILNKTYDLHAQQQIENIQTEHEKMFSEQGIKIKALVAKRVTNVTIE